MKNKKECKHIFEHIVEHKSRDIPTKFQIGNFETKKLEQDYLYHICKKCGMRSLGILILNKKNPPHQIAIK